MVIANMIIAQCDKYSNLAIQFVELIVELIVEIIYYLVVGACKFFELGTI